MDVKLTVVLVISASIGFVLTEDIGYFWQITDLHHDQEYSIHGNKTNSCHGTSAAESKPEDSPGMFGDPRCEAPWTLIKSAVTAMKSLHSNPDFVLWTGGIGSLTAGATQKKLTLDIKAASDLLLKAFNGTAIIPVLGNNDVIPYGQMPPANEKYYNDVLKYGTWDRMLSEDARKTFQRGGYYSVKVKPGLCVVVLNTNLYYTKNHLTREMKDPAGMLNWLRKFLREQRRKKQKVIIATHVPPGAHEWTANVFHMHPKFNQEYVNMIRSYSDVIGAQIYGHERNDTLRLFLGQDGKPINVGILAPPVSPFANTNKPMHPKANPGVRLIKYERSSGSILDIFQYYLDLDAANKAKEAHWVLEYQFTKAMKVKDLKPATVKKLVKKLSSDVGNSLFQKLYSWNRISLQNNAICMGVCRKVYMCAVQHVDVASYNRCMVNTSPINQTGSSSVGTNETTDSHPISNSTNSNPDYPSVDPYHRGSVPKGVIYVVMTIGLLVLVGFLAVTVYFHKRRKLYPKVSYHRIPKFDYD